MIKKTFLLALLLAVLTALPCAAESVEGLPLHVQTIVPGVVRVWVGDQCVLTWDDPDPLRAGHLAVWTRDNAIMVPRVTIYHRPETGIAG